MRCCSRQEHKQIPRWWKIKYTDDEDNEHVVDHIDLSPMPYTCDRGYVYYKQGVEHAIKGFKTAQLILCSVCNDPACEDPDCVAYRRKQGLTIVGN